jgi:hypothetical protein
MKTFVVLLMAAALLGTSAPAYAGRRGGHSSESHRSSGSSSKASTGTGVSPHSHPVHGYTRKNGTYVAPHRQTDPDHTQRNNYSTKGNTNPWTGKAGTKTATH